MRRSHLMPISFLLLLAACGSETTAPGSASAIAATEALADVKSVPMSGRFEGTGSFSTPPTWCQGLYSTFRGGGQESHTGRYTLDIANCTIPVDASTSTFSGTFTKTTANGDLIFGTQEGTARLTVPPGSSSAVGVFELSGTITFTGGTGRFAGATGQQQMEGTQWTDFSQAGFPSRMVLEFEGSISSVGSRHQ
jgi:hypothetical protein